MAGTVFEVAGGTASTEQKMAYVLLRVALGIDFLGHGFTRLLHGSGAFAQWMLKQMAGTPMPAGFVYGFGLILPPLEAIVGLLLLAGLLTRQVIILGALLMLCLMTGTALRQDWSTVALQLFYSLLFSILLFLRERYDASWPSLLRRG
jgi:thiosulfate dehydrogenase [quinone] large subunit